MKKTYWLTLTLSLSFFFVKAQVTPEISSWIRNTTNATGYSGIQSNVQIVQYSASNVYVSCTCIPAYGIGPWPGNPNLAANQNFVYKITRTPQKNTGTQTAVGLGHVGVWTNGVSIFNADDAMTYNNQGVWHRNAYFWEGSGFDACLGHPQQQGEYHHHVSPKCLYSVTDSTHHSPIIGWSFDGYPVYGAYAYTSTNGTGAIKRMTSSWHLRSMTDRTTLPGGATASSPGPPINGTYPLGAYIQDYEFIAGSGDLDSSNGRFCKTPEYPNGTYCYFVTVDASLAPVYPYTLGVNYYGVVPAGSTGPTSGHTTITETTTTYTGTSGVDNTSNEINFELYPNPVTDYAYIYFDNESANNVKASVYDIHGKLLQTIKNMQPSIAYVIDFTIYAAGMYIIHFETNKQKIVKKIVLTK